MRAYLDTSAAAKLIVDESESDALAGFLTDEVVDLVALVLLETELRRFVSRQGATQGEATRVIEGVSLYEAPRSLFREAGLLPGAGLRSLDALHLAGALRLEVDALVSYDDRLVAAARQVGVPCVTPR